MTNLNLDTKRAWSKQRNAEAQAIRALRQVRPYNPETVVPAFIVGWCMLLGAVILLMAMVGCAMAGELVDHQRLATAIYLAEGGPNTRHPYGILAKYKVTTPRQACLNTIRSNERRWKAAGSPGEYIDWLSRVYAPIGASNDPTGLNKNWAGNVKKLYAKNGGM